MSDYSELKRLAEALGGATWLLVDGDGFEADNRFVTSQQRIDDNKVAYAEINYGHPEAGMGEPFQSQQVTAGEFIAAANPAAVLELIAENERLRADYASLSTFNPDWDRVAAAQDSVREHMEIASKLRAENAGLKTGYEAYEAQNAALRAEVEALRKELAAFHPAQDYPAIGFTGCVICGVYTDHDGMLCPKWGRSIATAGTGKGEQS